MGGGVMRTAASAAPLLSAAGEIPAVAPAGSQWASWEVDDWEFADWRSESASEADVAVVGGPRLVFAPPSREEAEEATAELREAIDRVYFKETPVEVVKEHDQELSKLGADALIPAMPGHVVQAFTLLKSSPEAQSVVASLASDKNVWDAVLKNERVMEFYKSHQQTLVNTFPEGTDSTDSVESPEKFEEASPEYALPTASPLSDFVDNAKKTMMEMVDNITNFFQDLFHNPAEAEAGPGSSSKKPSFAEMAAGGSFMALAMAVILVVLFKRA
ncbi:uncharacterized protein [Aegilops tauschii subsp. strangulata]|uniref:Uncharacterized protein n=1 Tax=Triticum aestivum TaxID=4565 RepID=A0A3B6TI82_WHEAT|nr:uncharacterized protein LOC109784504 isoform X2 [Aegilops tauschii subsp. strangulata]XP_044438923.1 uncharacterized protein LOC123165356 isoform X2 [Triticum aestivum]